MAYKGKYTPDNPAKYVGNPTKITYRSLWERRFMKWCDTHPGVLGWGSEEIVVPYISPIDNRSHRYFVDFITVTKDRNGNQKVTLVEIKPHKQCGPPEKKGKITRRYINEVKRWGVNEAKWKAATEFAENRGWTFKVLTEKDIFKKNATKRKRSKTTKK